MHLHELMGWPGPMTHRQFEAWSSWLAEDQNRPSRGDQYVMAVAAEVRRGNVKQPRNVKLEHFRLKFGTKEKAPPVTREQAAAMAKARWFSRMTAPVKVVRNGPEHLQDPPDDD